MQKRESLCFPFFRVNDYFRLPNRPLMSAPEPLRMTELSAFLAARFAIVCALVVLPPVAAFIRLVLSALATEDAALLTAC